MISYLKQNDERKMRDSSEQKVVVRACFLLTFLLKTGQIRTQKKMRANQKQRSANSKQTWQLHHSSDYRLYSKAGKNIPKRLNASDT